MTHDDVVTRVHAAGARTQLVQHVTQLNVMLRAMPKPQGQETPTRIGFRLAGVAVVTAAIAWVYSIDPTVSLEDESAKR